MFLAFVVAIMTVMAIGARGVAEDKRKEAEQAVSENNEEKETEP